MTSLELVAVVAVAGVAVQWWRSVPPKPPVIPPRTMDPPGPDPGPKAQTYPGEIVHDAGTWVQLAAGPVWTVRNPARAWVTASTFDALISALLRYTELDATPIVILDASLRNGGPMAPHRSHREGRDVDLKFGGADPMPTRAALMLLRALVIDARLQAVFLAWSVQRRIWELLQADPGLEPSGVLAAELQYPLAAGTGRTRIRDWPGHHRHLHVRYRS